MTLNELEDKVLECKKCGELCSLSPFGYPHIGNKNSASPIMLIGQNPGKEHDYSEIKTKDDFLLNYDKNFRICNLYKEITSWVDGDASIWDKIFFTNIVKHPTPKLRNVSDIEIDNCIDYLKVQIYNVKPRIIITLGSPAFTGILKHMFNKDVKFAEAKNRFHLLANYKSSIRFLPLYHPSFLSYNSQFRPMTIKLFKEGVKHANSF